MSSTTQDRAVTEVTINADGTRLTGDLDARGRSGLVVFAHGSGSTRRGPRNAMVAERLAGHGLSTLLLDLLTDEEQEVDACTRHLRFDIDLLASRMIHVLDWIDDRSGLGRRPIGLFGASTGAAAALIAAAERPALVRAVVSRGGRPDLAGEALVRVRAPTQLIVGSLDTVVIELNRQSKKRLVGASTLEVVAGASHLFEEPGKLERVCQLAGDWFRSHLSDPAPPRAVDS